MLIQYWVYIGTRTSNVVSSLGRRMTADEIGVYLVDQVANSCDSRTFNARIEGRIPMKLSSSAESSASIQRPKSFTSDFKGNFRSHLLNVCYFISVS